MESVLPCPLAASVAMLSCCSTIAAPMAAKAMMSAMVCRCRLFFSSRSASVLLTPSSSPPVSEPLISGFSRLMIAVTSMRHSVISAALTSSRLAVPIRSACSVSELPAMPPRLAPPPMKPKMRLACRGSYTSLASVQNWLITRMPRMRPKK